MKIGDIINRHKLGEFFKILNYLVYQTKKKEKNLSRSELVEKYSLKDCFKLLEDIEPLGLEENKEQMKTDEIIDQYILGDCLEILPYFPSRSIDLLIIDPPNILLNKHYKTRKWFPRRFGDLGTVSFFFSEFFKHIKRVMKKSGFIYIFCSSDTYPFFWFYCYPFTKNVRDIIWDKVVSFNGYSWRHQHETLLFAEMPKAPIVKTGEGDIFKHRAVKVDNREHPAEKPPEVIQKLIQKSSKKGDLVVDFFAGGGIVLEEAKKMGRHFFGCEFDKDYYKICKERLESIDFNSELPQYRKAKSTKIDSFIQNNRK
jgi:DNA modification methylase